MSQNPTLVVQLTGTSPLSFEVTPGSSLTIRRFSESDRRRPTVGSGFKTSAFVVFSGITKVGQINKKDVSFFETSSPRKCIALEVNKEQKKFTVGIFI